MSEKVLVMGGTYFIGKRIVEVLLEQNYEVYILNRGNKIVEDQRITNLISDRNDIATMKTVLNPHKFDVVIDVSGVKPEQINILLESMNTDALEQFIFISSSAVYDLDNETAPYKESSNLKSNSYWNTYSQNKIDSEKVLINYLNDKDVIVSILRPPFVYGENNYAPRESFIFEHILNDKPIIVPGKGETRLQFIYTMDLAMIIAKLIVSPPQSLNIYNVGNQDAITMIEWVNYCEKVVNKKAVIVNFDYMKYKLNPANFFPFYDYDNVLDVSNIKKYYSHETDFLVGLGNAYEWYKEYKDTIKLNDTVSKTELMILDSLLGN